MSSTRSRYSIFCGSGSAVLGFFVLSGWYLKIPLLIQLHPSFVPMQYNTALGFLVCGAGIIFLNFNRLKLSSIAGVFALLIGGLTLIQYVFLVDLGLDQLFMEHYITVKTYHPGRMAPNTALCFSIAGSCLLISSLFREQLSTASTLIILGGLILTLSFVPAMGYLIGMETAYGWGNLTRMALHTSIGFLIVGSGIIALILKRSHKTISNFWFSPIPWSISLIIVSLLLFQASSYHEKKLIKREIMIQADSLKNRIIADVNSRILAISRMGKRWESSEKVFRQDWESDAREYLKHYPSYRAIQWVDSTYIVRWIVPLKGNEPAKDLNLTFNQKSLENLEKAKSSGAPRITSVIDLVQGGKVFFIIVPLIRDGKSDGFIIAVLSLDKFLQQIFNKSLSNDLSIEIYQHGKTVFESSKEKSFDDSFWHIEHSFKVAGTDWAINFWPKKSLIDQTFSPISLIILSFGILISLLVGSVVFLIQKKRIQLISLKNLTANLNSTLEHNRLILESIGDGIFGLDKQGNTTFVNPATERMLGYTAKEFYDRHQHDLIHHSRNDGSPYPSEECHIYNSIENGESQSVSDEVFWRKDGTSFPVEYFSSPIRVNGNVTGAVVTFRDISERKRIAEELDQFAYVVSHDLRTPLRGIDNLSKWIQEDLGENIPEVVEQNFKLMRKRVLRLEDMISGLLEYSRAGRIQNKHEIVDTNKLVDDIVDFLALPENYCISHSDNMPTLVTDKIRIQQVFQNLIDNAVKHHNNVRPGEIKINWTDTGLFYEFIVSDNGPGIEEKYFDKIFQMFQTLEVKDKTSNSGLGLALVKKIIESYGGKITIESNVGQGTTFRFTWPKVIQ